MADRAGYEGETVQTMDLPRYGPLGIDLLYIYGWIIPIGLVYVGFVFWLSQYADWSMLEQVAVFVFGPYLWLEGVEAILQFAGVPVPGGNDAE